MSEFENRRAEFPESLCRLLFLPTTVLALFCLVGCDLVTEKFKGGEAVAKHVIERYFDAEKFKEPIDGFWCAPGAAPRRFERLKNFDIVKSRQENADSKSESPRWFAFRVVTRSRTIKAYSGEDTERHMVYVRKALDGSYRIFGLVPEQEAQDWESVKSRIRDRTNPCAFPE